MSSNFWEQQIPGSVGLSGALNFTEQPTVTYLPLQGNDFIQQLVSPITLDTIILLANLGWSIKRILRLTVQRINAPTASGLTPKSAPEYEALKEIVDLLQVMQNKGEM